MFVLEEKENIAIVID